jgi:hypothetical protein
MEKKIVVPEGMSLAVGHAVFEECGSRQFHPLIRVALEAALRWLSVNPIVPTAKQFVDLFDELSEVNDGKLSHRCVVEWQRRMFLAPEPEVPEAVSDLTVEMIDGIPDYKCSRQRFNSTIAEAYRRGQQSKS